VYLEVVVTRAALALPPDLDERTLVCELTHRVNNQLASAIDVVTAAAVRAEHPEAKVALGNIADLLQEQANVHRVLTIPEGDTLVDAAQYLRQLCLATTRSRLEPIGVHLSFQADTLPLEAERCWRLGMAVHELLTNSARHACFDGRAGEIKIRLSLRDQVVNCIIADNGSLSGRLKPARGLGIVHDLIKSLGGRLEYGFGPEYSSFLLVFLLTERERRANKAVASRRTRTRRRLKTISSPKQTTRRQLPNAAGTPWDLHGPTPGSNAPQAHSFGADRTTDEADVLASLLAKPASSSKGEVEC
jgi:two-component sensor histidine kinase